MQQEYEKISTIYNLPSDAPAKKAHGVGYDGMGGHYKFDEFPNPRTTKLLMAAKKKYITKKGGRGGCGRGRGASQSHKAGQVNILHDYFKNTFDFD